MDFDTCDPFDVSMRGVYIFSGFITEVVTEVSQQYSVFSAPVNESLHTIIAVVLNKYRGKYAKDSNHGSTVAGGPN